MRSLNVITKSIEKISNIFQKDFVYLSLENKKFLFLYISLYNYIKAISYYYFPSAIKLDLLNLEYK